MATYIALQKKEHLRVSLGVKIPSDKKTLYTGILKIHVGKKIESNDRVIAINSVESNRAANSTKTT